MKERPIIFSGAMVRAILDGRKTRTRRCLKPQPQESYSITKRGDGWHKHSYGWSWQVRPDMPCVDVRQSDLLAMWCPYGVPGDRLWVRETWRPAVEGVTAPPFFYRADGDTESEVRWHPSIHMPRWASRITLEITGVLVERLQEISVSDAKAEGVDEFSVQFPVEFKELWDSINGSRPGCSWADNPWVWVIGFRRV